MGCRAKPDQPAICTVDLKLKKNSFTAIKALTKKEEDGASVPYCGAVDSGVMPDAQGNVDNMLGWQDDETGIVTFYTQCDGCTSQGDEGDCQLQDSGKNNKKIKGTCRAKSDQPAICTVDLKLKKNSFTAIKALTKKA